MTRPPKCSETGCRKRAEFSVEEQPAHELFEPEWERKVCAVHLADACSGSDPVVVSEIQP